MEAKYVLKEKKGMYYFELYAPNGQLLATSEKFSSNAGLYNGIKSVQTNSQTTVIDDKRKSEASF